MELYDGIKQVDKIAIFALLKNCGEYLEYVLFPTFEKLENAYDVEFSYYFLENGSIDSTNSVIEKFLKGRNGLMINDVGRSFDDASNTNYSIQFTRISKMAYLRNLLFDSCRQYITDVDWLLFVDDGIRFDENVLYRLFSKYPAKNNIGILAPYSCEMLKQEGNGFTSFNHYYDTFALVYSDGINTRPFCRFMKCSSCFNSPVRLKLDSISMIQYIIDVRSCFGGFLLVDNSCMKNKNIRWETVGLYTISEMALSEHIMFCNYFRAITNKRICIAQDVTVWCNQLKIS